MLASSHDVGTVAWMTHPGQLLLAGGDNFADEAQETFMKKLRTTAAIGDFGHRIYDQQNRAQRFYRAVFLESANNRPDVLRKLWRHAPTVSLTAEAADHILWSVPNAGYHVEMALAIAQEALVTQGHQVRRTRVRRTQGTAREGFIPEAVLACQSEHSVRVFEEVPWHLEELLQLRYGPEHFVLFLQEGRGEGRCPM